MSDVLNFLVENGCPFMANVYPYFKYIYNNSQISLDSTFFRSSNHMVNDGFQLYKRLFDALVDSVASAMERMGHYDIPIIITKSKWPRRHIETYIFYSFNKNKDVKVEEDTKCDSPNPCLLMKCDSPNTSFLMKCNVNVYTKYIKMG